MEKKTFKKGDIVCREGSKGDAVYVIREGSVKVFKMINGEKIELGSIGKNDMFGELSLFLNSRRTASIEALENTEILILDYDSVVDEISKDPKFGMMMLKKLAHRVQDAHKVITKLQGEKKSLELMCK